TLAEHRVVAMQVADGIGEADALRLAAAVERDSEHPVARAIVASAEERGLDVPRVESFRAIPGHGVEPRALGRELQLGGPNVLRTLGVEPAPALVEAAAQAAARGQSAVYLVEASRALAAFAVADAVRPESREAIARLHAAKIEVVMLTGDAKSVA